MDTTALAIVEQPALPAELLGPLRLAADFAKASRAASTLSAYRSDVKIFTEWAAARGASVFKMKEVSRHKSLDVLGGYVRDANLFRDHAGSGLL
jgi:hypothetical protein